MIPSIHKAKPMRDGTTLIGVVFTAPLGWFSIPMFHDAESGELWDALHFRLVP